MANPPGTLVKPIRGAPDGGFLGVDFGRSTSVVAESGVAVTFNTPFNAVPRVTIGQHQEKVSWIDPASVTVGGFTWFGEEDVSGIDWIAIGT